MIDPALVDAVALVGDNDWYEIDPGSFEMIAFGFSGDGTEYGASFGPGFRFVPIHQAKDEGAVLRIISGPLSSIAAVRYR